MPTRTHATSLSIGPRPTHALRFHTPCVISNRVIFSRINQSRTPPNRHTHTGRPRIYDRFMANVVEAGHADVIVPVVATSLVGMKVFRGLHNEGRVPTLPQVIYLDSAHEPDETFFELKIAWEILSPGGVLFGDDFGWVRGDVTRFADDVMGPLDLGNVSGERLKAAQAKLGPEAQFVGKHNNTLLYKDQWVLFKALAASEGAAGAGRRR